MQLKGEIWNGEKTGLLADPLLNYTFQIWRPRVVRSAS